MPFTDPGSAPAQGSQPVSLPPKRGATTRVRAVRYEAAHALPASVDHVVTEEPLEVRLAGEPFAVTMRTPGRDRELAFGLLRAEGVLSSREDVNGLAHCGKPGTHEFRNTINVTPAAGGRFCWDAVDHGRRGTLVTASCGVCGRRSIDDLIARCGPIHDETRFTPETLAKLPERLRGSQPTFDATGGLHAAGLATSNGTLVCVREDVGRHNAVDKVVGKRLLDGLSCEGHALVISGRSSFEMVQKAIAARIPLVMSVSAPSSLAVAAAESGNITLVGFARAERFNVYAGAQRLRAT